MSVEMISTKPIHLATPTGQIKGIIGISQNTINIDQKALYIRIRTGQLFSDRRWTTIGSEEDERVLDRFGRRLVKMLAVFDNSVAKSPEGLAAAIGESDAGEKGFAFGEHFSAANHGAVCVGLGSSGLMAYTSEKQNPFIPRSFMFFFYLRC